MRPPNPSSISQAILAVLAAHPKGLTTGQIAAKIEQAPWHKTSRNLHVLIGNLKNEGKLTRIDPRSQPSCELCGAKRAIYIFKKPSNQ